MKVEKTVKMYVGGAFIRSESGRTSEVKYYKSKDIYARVNRASRKDLRNTTEKALSGHSAWSSKSSFNRSQIMYRMAEMCESKKQEFIDLFMDTLGMTKKQALTEVDQAIDTFVFYAGFCDKFQHLGGGINPVSGRFHNFSFPEPLGVVAIVDDKKFKFAHLIDRICSVLVSGNSVIVLHSDTCPGVIAPLGEVMATSDVPGGVVNLLNGDIKELSSHLGSQGNIHGVLFANTDKELEAVVKEKGAETMKRVVRDKKEFLSLEAITNFTELKTIWHPIGI